MTMNRFAYAMAQSVSETVQALDENCRPLAGGTDLLGMMKEGLAAPSRLVNIKGIVGLDQVVIQEDGLRVGALTRLFSLIDALEGQPGYEVLRQALLRTATPQIRHMATVGGNLVQRPRCWYFRNKLTHCLRKGGDRCFAYRGENKYHALLGGGPCYIVHPSDMAVALLALDASVIVAGPGGERTVPLSDFYQLPKQDAHHEADLAENELLTHIGVPQPEAGARGTYVKIAERQSWDFALVSVAMQVVLVDGVVRQARVALGGVAPVPWHARQAEAVLVGGPLSEERAAQAAQAAMADARPLAQNAYKIEMIHGAFKEAARRLL